MFLLKTIIVRPIRTENKLFGVLYAATSKEEISRADLESLTAFASQAALAIRNARQYEHVHERLRRRVRELQSLQNIERLISSTSDLEMMLKNILDVGLKLVDAKYGTIVLADQPTGELVPQVSHPEGSISPGDYEPGLSGWVAQEKQTRREADLSTTLWADSYGDMDIRSELAAPILAGSQLMGVITMGSEVPAAFSEEDESLLNILATQTAVALQTAHYYQELEMTRLRSLEAERIAAMSDIATNMVHSINNSDGAIRVLVQQLRLKLERGSLTDEFLSKRLDDIHASAEKTLEMARNIRNPFQDQPTEPIDINDCIGAVLDTFQPLAPTIDLILDLEDGRPLSVLGTRQLGEVFRNLIKNAIEAMDSDGSLLITSRQMSGGAMVSVADSGPGIPPHLTETDIFKLGVTGKEGGLGYGLWWCQIYLNRVGGTISLDRDVTAGCRFVVELTAVSEAGELS
jgi:signal transduction histidine kinase